MTEEIKSEGKRVEVIEVTKEVVGNTDDKKNDNQAFRKKRPFGVKRVSYFTKNPTAPIDYKRVDILVQFTSEKGKILPRRITGITAIHQRKIAKAIKRARMAGLLPFSVR